MQTTSDVSPEMRRGHASTGVIFRIVDNLVYFVAFLSKDVYKGREKICFKFPTETDEAEINETPWQTMLRGLDSEVGDLSCNPGELTFESFLVDEKLEPQPLIVVEFVSEIASETAHDKFVYLLQIAEGNESFFRKDSKQEHDCAELAPPKFIEARKLLNLMMETLSPPYHLMALVRSLNCLARDPQIFDQVFGQYEDILLDKAHSHFTGSDEAVQFFFWDQYLNRMKRKSIRHAKPPKIFKPRNVQGRKH